MSAMYKFSLFCYHLPLEKGCGPINEQTLVPFTHRCFVLCLVEIGPVVLEKETRDKFQLQNLLEPLLWLR